ncbi:phage holin family protein [Paenibacillus forsythiae]|uniref:phage holin family protein n=1 Tax=Paenibacillus forsythiae TaxID=365616 RepID=UPI00056869EF|nr:phage holin family protein [Paenibacillus forsythiae]
MKLNKPQIFVSALGAIFVPLFDFLYGEADAVVTIMAALLFFVVMDWLSGIRAAKKDHTYASKYGIDGVFRTFFILLLPAGGNLLDGVFGLPGAIFGALAIGTIYHVLQSMTANSIRAGWGDWLPLPVLDSILKWVGSELDKKIKRAAERKGAEE